MAAGIFELGGPVFQGIREKGREEGLEEGRKKALAEAVQLVLQKRGFTLSTEEHARIDDCHDPELLDRWFHRAFDATSVAEVFHEEPGDGAREAAE